MNQPTYCLLLAAFPLALVTSCAGPHATSLSTNTPQVATPTFNPGAGAYTSTQSVTIADTTAGAGIYYTTDGSSPTTSSTKYSGSIAVSASETISAIAVLSGDTNSVIASSTYTISLPQAAMPTFNPSPGTYAATEMVSIGDATAGAAIYYTLNGTTPTQSSNRYTSPIPVASSETIKAIAIASGYANSSVASATYTIAVPSTFVTVNQSILGAPTTDQILGMNMAIWYDPTTAAIIPALQTIGTKTLRWPGGSDSDYYHWQTNTLCNGGYVGPNTYFVTFADYFAIPGNFDVAVTANYGTNSACNSGGDPTEAAAWVTEALNTGNKVTHWTIGNEVFGYWEPDLHAIPHDPTTYANAVATGYYPLMKAANPNALVGVVVDGGYTATWDRIVLSQAPYDFVEYHFYAQIAGHENDAFLVAQAAQQLTAEINKIRTELATAGHPNTPIYLGEMGSVNTNPGKQTSSITQALYAGQVLGELMNAGISRASWWIGFGGCSDATSGNFSSSLYGWQNFGGYMVFSDGLPAAGCPGAAKLTAGTLLPTARAYQLFSTVAKNGEHVLPVSVSGDTADVRAYAATSGAGAVVVLFNLNQAQSQTISIALSGQFQSSAVMVETYDKAIYDQSQNNVWAAPTTTSLGSQALPLTLTLTPWSMNIVTIPQ